MAPVGEAYFPPLDRCFNGEHELLSWKTTYVALSLPDNGHGNLSLRSHLTDPQSIHILAHAFDPFSPPTPQTKSSFETKTSAINVTPSSHARYDIKQIQEDTLWLSKEAKIDEVSALRIAVLEWQSRSAVQLLHGPANDQTGLANGGGSQLGASIFDPGASLLAKSTFQGSDGVSSHEDSESRRRRLLETYLSERRSILKVSEFMTSCALSAQDLITTDAGPRKENQHHWLREVGAEILSSWSLSGSTKSGRKHPVIDAVNALRSRLDGLGTGCGWLQEDGIQEDIEHAWARSQILEMIHIMQITLNLLLSASDLVNASSILSWFRLMKDCDFYDGVQLSNPTLKATFGVALISLPALISLAIINVSSALELLEQPSTTGLSAAPARDHVPYLLDSPAVNELNDILISTAPMKPASLATMAWAIIMSKLRDTALSTRELREVRQSLRAADKYGAADSSDTDGGERPFTRSRASLRRRSSTGSDTSQQSTLLEEIYDTVAVVPVDGDPVLYLADNAVTKGSLFDVVKAIAVDYCSRFGFEHNGKPGQNMRVLLLHLIKASLEFVEYQPHLVTATIAVLTGSERFWDDYDRPINSNKIEPAVVFLQDKVLTGKLFLVSMIHFPYQAMPFLQLCRSVAFANDETSGKPALWNVLGDVDTFTCALPSKDYQGYVPANTQEEADFIELTEPLSLSINSDLKSSFRSARNALVKLDDLSTTHEIPSGTLGRLMNDSKPFIVAWSQVYSALKYMGKVLQCASMVPNLQESRSSFISVDIVSSIIGLIANMLSAAVKSISSDSAPREAPESPHVILSMASDGMGRNQDIVSVIFDIFERQLYKEHKTSEHLGSLEILVQCVQFTFALLQVIPDRVWPFLGRSGLLGIGKEESQLKRVVATQEMILGRYDFLIGCIRLFDSLVEDCVSHTVSRKNPSRAVARWGITTSSGAGISQIAMEKVLLSFTQMMIEVYEGTATWNFVLQEDRMEINYRISSIFQKMLRICFDANDNQNISQNPTGALAPAAEYMIDVFLLSSSNDVTILPILQILTEGVATRTTTLPTRRSKYWTAQVVGIMNLVTTLIRVNRLLERPAARLDNQMFKAASTIAKLYSAHEIYKRPVVDLLDALVRSASTLSRQPPSLLGHLGQETSTYFLDVLSKFDQPLEDDGLSTAIWQLMSAVVSKRQQWFAILILTGETPRESFKDKANSTASSARRMEPILNYALDSLANIDKLAPRKALDILEFVSLAADYWPWVLATIEKHTTFLKAISEFAAHIGSAAATSRGRSHDRSKDYTGVQMASLIADILSMYTHHTQQMGNEKFARMLVPHLTYLIKNAISAPDYNSSLHRNLRQNFEAKFPGCKLADLKRTAITRPQLGASFYYDLEFADKILSYNRAWTGLKGRHGFAEEVKRANLNLSVVEAQVNIFNSWKSLLVELSGPLAKEPKFQRIMAVAATDCLRANVENQLPGAIFGRLAQSRADLAFTLLQRLLEVKSMEADVKDILSVTWGTVRACDPDVGSALDGDDAGYYRLLLKTLYLALQFHTTSIGSENNDASQADSPARRSTPNAATPISLEILSTIIAQGFRSLTIILHDKSALAQPSDFSLLTAILRSILQIPDVTRNTTHLLNAFADSQTARCASTLLSWSDQLATSGDPIYGELSILFLLEMSSVPALAESLAVEGVLSHILSTNLIQLLQSRPFGPFDQPPRMYSIWARGILPFLLNLLHAVGPPLAAEIAAALNTFPHQLERASSTFGSSSRRETNQDYITLTMTSEAATLSLITTILQTFREAGSSAAVVSSSIEDVRWDRAQVKDDIEGLLEKRGTLRERIVPTNEREEGWSTAKPVGEGSVAENRLEEKVAEEMGNIVGILGGGGD